MQLPEDARPMGVQSRWVGYVGVGDVDATAARIRQLGGAVHVPPTNIPDIGHLAIVADPQTATLALVKWHPSRQEQSAPAQPAEVGTAGCVGWHELLAADWETAFAFYHEIFDWRKADADIDPTGTYQLFAAGGETIGGMFTRPPTVPFAFWLYYFNIADIDAAAERVKAAGGKVLEGPLQVAGGGRIARCTDPQGAMFALTGKRSDKAVGYFERAASYETADVRFGLRRRPGD
jgi:hypothetical protein